MTERVHKTPRQKYGEELRRRRIAAEMTQQQLAELVVCSHTLISHIEAGRKLPQPDDARRIDQALGTDGWFERWLQDLEHRYADHFTEAAELEQQAIEIKEYAATLIPGVFQTEAYARAVFRAFSPNYRAEDLEQRVVNRISRSRILDNPLSPTVWTMMCEGVLRRRVGGGAVMAEQLHKVGDLAEAGRIRLHVIPFSGGEHALMESMLSLMAFVDMAPVGYVEGVLTGQLMDDPARVRDCRAAYNLALGDALPHKQSLALLRAAAEEHSNAQ
ncbi:helix-turn-helix transcriptional regulator [Streptomyces sp. 891-h]|uniref:helix-turn-helix domain-containing protein n=1 Tax=unclassified Streptomyces TaxID=2593676 RepID=UPI001FAA2F01|nr:helix-turn-helix transcriptional regulator [Streptomyces sp. 891-h]UNZ18620.1 helix-turn-helix domain-containing protein [Streptomyces sp. 891-h]